MIAVPYGMLSVIGFLFYRMYKKHQRTLDTAATSCDSSPLQGDPTEVGIAHSVRAEES
jgi:hypothetical protein